jgi:hypothetical protein
LWDLAWYLFVDMGWEVMLGILDLIFLCPEWAIFEAQFNILVSV